MPRAPVFDQTYQHYLEKIAGLDLAACRDMLAIEMDGDAAVVPLLDTPYRISAQAVADPRGRRPSLGTCVILFKYLLMCPLQAPPDESYCTFRDFKNAAPLVHYFESNAQGEVASRFAGRRRDLQAACELCEGRPYVSDLGYAVKYRFQGLPKVPLYLLFNDQEEGFPAQCTFLFHRSAEAYLDMESLAMLGADLALKLAKADRAPDKAV